MANAQRLTERFPLANPTDEYSHIEVEVFFSRGGINYISGDRNPKGYALSFRGVMVKDGAVSFMMFTGWNRAFVLQPAERFNARTLAKLRAQLDLPALVALFEAKNYDALRETLRATFAPVAA